MKQEVYANKESFLNNLHLLEKTNSISALVETIFKAAIEWSASDIHLEPTANSFWIRFRMDGVLQEIAHLSLSLTPNIIARIKVLSDLLTYRTDICQEGSIRNKDIILSGKLDLRVSIVPVLFGEKVVVRILKISSQNLELDSLGFPKETLENIYSICKQSQGLLLFTGPAGSGKTTSIYSTLSYLVKNSKGSKNIVSIEDPVECVVPGITQTQINPSSGLDFAGSLRAILRQDPEIIMLGEIRDTKTAQIAIQSGLTGHFVISTVHSARAAGVFIRLIEMGVDPFLLRSSIQMIVAQRLVRILCNFCKQIDTNIPAEFSHKNIYKPGKCKHCKYTGYHNRHVLAECLLVNAKLRNCISKQMDEKKLEELACENGMVALPEIGRFLIDSGITSIEEIQRVLP